ncbi:hypothetical protein [Listeria aquatica]
MDESTARRRSLKIIIKISKRLGY